MSTLEWWSPDYELKSSQLYLVETQENGIETRNLIGVIWKTPAQRIFYEAKALAGFIETENLKATLNIHWDEEGLKKAKALVAFALRMRGVI